MASTSLGLYMLNGHKKTIFSIEVERLHTVEFFTILANLTMGFLIVYLLDVSAYEELF